MRRQGHRGTRTATWLHRRGVASIESVTRLRRELNSWVLAVGVSKKVAYDLVLGCYEAMANVVAHAYPAGTAGVVDVSARLRNNDIIVTVTDRGRWEPGTDTAGGGLGLALIRRLSDGMDLRRDEHGTRVRMLWHRT